MLLVLPAFTCLPPLSQWRWFMVLALLQFSGCGKPTYSLKVGVLENRLPSPNSRVWIIPTTTLQSLDKMKAESKEGWDRHTENMGQLIKKRDRDAQEWLKLCKSNEQELEKIKEGYEFNVLHGVSKSLADDIARRGTTIQEEYMRERTAIHKEYVSSLDAEGDAIATSMKEEHAQFLENLSTQLDRIAIDSRKCSMDGTATFDGIKEKEVTVFVVPATKLKFRYAFKSLQLDKNKEFIAEPKPSGF